MTQKIKNSRVLRVLDLLSNAIMYSSGAYEQMEEKSILLRIRSMLRSFEKTQDTSNAMPQDYLLIIGQVPTDANFLLHSEFSNHLELLKKCRSCSAGEIVFREHPLYRGMYEPDLYLYITNDKKTRVSRGTDLDQEIRNAARTIVVNSTVGLEVLLNHHRRPVCLGASAYQGACFNDISTAITAQSDHLTEDEKVRILKWFETNYLEGHFRDVDLDSLAARTMERIHHHD